MKVQQTFFFEESTVKMNPTKPFVLQNKANGILSQLSHFTAIGILGQFGQMNFLGGLSDSIKNQIPRPISFISFPFLKLSDFLVSLAFSEKKEYVSYENLSFLCSFIFQIKIIQLRMQNRSKNSRNKKNLLKEIGEVSFKKLMLQNLPENQRKPLLQHLDKQKKKMLDDLKKTELNIFVDNFISFMGLLSMISMFSVFLKEQSFLSDEDKSCIREVFTIGDLT